MMMRLNSGCGMPLKKLSIVRLRFDVYQDVYGDDKIRRLIIRSVTTGFASLTFYSASRLFLQDRKKSIPKLGGNLFRIVFTGEDVCAITA